MAEFEYYRGTDQRVKLQACPLDLWIKEVQDYSHAEQVWGNSVHYTVLSFKGGWYPIWKRLDTVKYVGFSLNPVVNGK